MRRLDQLGLVPANDLSPAAARPTFTHRNRHGVVYYLHQGATKTGKPRYFFAQTVRESALDEMPAGFEVAESTDGVVSVRKVAPGWHPPAEDLALVRAALDRDPALCRCIVESKYGAILLHEPQPHRGSAGDDLAGLAHELGVSADRLTAYLEKKRREHVRYEPIMKFAPPLDGAAGHYVAYRIKWRGGASGWRTLAHGPLTALVEKYLPHVGRPSFFETT
jgi:hypothetical protein